VKKSEAVIGKGNEDGTVFYFFYLFVKKREAVTGKRNPDIIGFFLFVVLPTRKCR